MTKESFHVHFVSKDKVNVVCVKARTEIQREFKSLKGAANFVKEVGFKSFEVNL